MLQGRDRQFQSTPPARGATVCVIRVPPQTQISIHAPREGGDSAAGWWQDGPQTFQSTPPARGATCTWRTAPADRPYFNPRPPRGGRRTKVTGYNVFTTISIHAPREGGDRLQCFFRLLAGISIHAPREGGDVQCIQPLSALLKISIHAPREGGDLLQRLSARNCQIISIHAPREGGDTVQNRLSYGTERFQSTPPARGATPALPVTGALEFYFNPRPPRGGRLHIVASQVKEELFQSTPPARGATTIYYAYAVVAGISIHAPREGGDFPKPSILIKS